MNTDIIMNNTTPNYVAVKVTKGEEMRRFQFSGKSFQEIKDAISQLFGIPVDDFTLQYEDDEKDRVTLSSDAELNEAIKLHKNVLRFYVVSKSAPAAATIAHVHGLPLFPPAFPSPPAAVLADGEVASPVTPPHPYHGHHHHGHPYRGHGGMRGGRHGFPGHEHHHGAHYEHHHHKNKRHDREEREAWKLEKKRCKKQRRDAYSSSSSSSEEDLNKVQKKEMKQLLKTTKQQIKKNWEATKAANPAQWPENRKLMIAEIKAAKKLIHEGANKPNVPVPVEQTVAIVNVGTEMQA